MENKINVAELLKDCPSGMELDCSLYDNVTLVQVKEGYDYPIVIETPNGQMLLSKYGCFSKNELAKCIIFPKGETTWEGFVAPCKFKDGDIVALENECGIHIFIYNYITNEYNGYGYYVIFTSRSNFKINGFCNGSTYRFATEEEKEKLFQAIKENGYSWNPETKTLEKLVKPKFKFGDRIKSIISSSYYTVVDIKNDQYFIKSDTEKYPYQVHFSNEINYKLVLDKFEITTLKPFDRVLMRSSNAREWVATFYSHYSNNKFYGCGMCCDQCIPYEGNEHLLGTTNECNEYFKNW